MKFLALLIMGLLYRITSAWLPLVFTTLLLLCSARTLSAGTIERFSISRDGEVLVVPVRIGGEVHPFAVSTGNPVSIIDQSLRKLLHLKALVAGPSKKSRVSVPNAKLGSISLEFPDGVDYSDLTPLSKAGWIPVSGILGMDALRSLIIQVDFDSGLLYVLDEVPDEAGSRIDVRFVGPEKRTPTIPVMIPDAAEQRFEICTLVDSFMTIDDNLFQQLINRRRLRAFAKTRVVTEGKEYTVLRTFAWVG